MPAAPASPPSSAAATAHRLPPAPRRRPMPHSPTAPILRGREPLRGPGDRHRRQRRPDPGHLQLVDRHRRSGRDHRLRPLRPYQRPHTDLHLQLRARRELRMLDRQRNPQLRLLRWRQLAYSRCAIGRWPLHVPGPGHRQRGQSWNRDPEFHARYSGASCASTHRNRSRLSGEPELAQGNRQRSGRINGPPLHNHRLLGDADRDHKRGGTGDWGHRLGPRRHDDEIQGHGY